MGRWVRSWPTSKSATGWSMEFNEFVEFNEFLEFSEFIEFSGFVN
jgi:hypothetical protein